MSMFIVSCYISRSETTVAYGPFETDQDAREYLMGTLMPVGVEDACIQLVNAPSVPLEDSIVDAIEWVP